VTGYLDEPIENGKASTRSARFAPASRAPGQARAFVSEILRSWGVSGALAGDIVLAASELVTNAVEHGRGEVAVELRRHGKRIRLRVGDGAAETPVLRRPEPQARRGRGIALIEAVSMAWGTQPRAGGKWVWAEFRSGG
jgi:anti-sigma regulatory factor (Ser/Thr protein kinase)